MDQDALQQKLKASVGLSNEILSDEEEQIVREMLHNSYNTALELDAEIPRIRWTLRYFEKQRADEARWMARLRVGVSPQKKVPPEILGRIFELCDDDESNVINMPLHPRSRCLVLSQVCSRWRQVALAEPSLWNVVSIDYPDKVHPDTLKAILSRAGHAITLNLAMVHIPPPVLRVIRQYSNKFHTVELRVDYCRKIKYLKVPFARLGALRILRLDIENACFYAGLFHLYPAISAFKSASDLQQFIVIDTFGLDLDTPSPVSFPWLHLQHLMSYCGIPFTVFSNILAHCTQLVSCEASLIPDRGPNTLSPFGSGTYILQNLVSLKLDTYLVSIDEVLNSIVAPSLRALKIKYSPTSPNTLFNLIRRSNCNIHRIHVALVPTPSPDIERLLLAVPSVVESTLVGPNMIDETILDSISTGDLLPNVEVLECRILSCRAIREIVSNICEPSPYGSNRAIKKFTARVPKKDITSEWQALQASLPQDGAVRIVLGDDEF